MIEIIKWIHRIGPPYIGRFESLSYCKSCYEPTKRLANASTLVSRQETRTCWYPQTQEKKEWSARRNPLHSYQTYSKN